MNNPPKIGVAVMRLQCPLPHAGHNELFKAIAKRSDKVAIVLGETPVRGSMRDPLPYWARERTAKMFWPEADVHKLWDSPGSNERWSANLDSLLERYYPGAEITLYGSRDSFIPYYSGKLATVELKIDVFSEANATEIRKQIFDGEIVPHGLVETMMFNAGLIAQAGWMFPTSYATVDAAAVFAGCERPLIVLGKKRMDGLYCLPGGFRDPQLDTDPEQLGKLNEQAACRELREETGIDFDYRNAHQIGSFHIDDNRYKRREDQIGTELVLIPLEARHLEQIVAGDDLAAGCVHLVDLYSLTRDQVVDEHWKLILAVVRELGRRDGAREAVLGLRSMDLTQLLVDEASKPKQRQTTADDDDSDDDLLGWG